MRVKRGTAAKGKHKKILKMAKGYKGSGKNKFKAAANVRVIKAGVHAYRDRRKKKKDFRALWIQRISAALKPLGVSYSRFINQLNKANVKMDRKILADLAAREPETFKQIVEKVKG